MLKATPLLFLHLQIFLCSGCLRLLPHEQHMNAGQYFTCQGDDKKCNSSGGWLPSSLCTHSCYQGMVGVGLNTGLKLEHIRGGSECGVKIGHGLTPMSAQKLQSWRKLSSIFPREGERGIERIIPTLLRSLRTG